jgi:serine/threonine protein kinase
MPITIQCPNPACGASANVADTVAGRGVKCKKCGTPFKAVPTLDGQRSDTRPTSTGGDPFPSLPAEFGRYRVVKLLGKGGMGAVYLAEDTQLGRPVALKLPSFDANEKKRVERFVREARAAAGLLHPYICPVYDAGQINGRPFMTMAYIRGDSLEKAIDPDSPMDQRRAAEVARNVALAIQEAHEKGIVHRDLKPANVMLNAKGEPVVMDFGLAKRISETDPNEAKLTQQGAVMGTPSYMAPEQVKGEIDKIGPATDVYALGVMLFEMLTGQTPYQGSLGMVMGQILTAAVPPVEEFRKDADPRLAAVCRRAMAKDPAARFPSMAAVAEALTEYLTPTAVSVSLVQLPPAAPSPPPPPPTVTETVNEFAAIDVTGEVEAARPAPRKPKKAKKRPKKSNPAAWIAAAAAAVLAVIAVVVVTVRTPHGDVTIELSDPAAAVEVKVDGNRIELANLDKPLTLTAGEHGLTVTGADFETTTQQFTVKKGDKQAVKVTLKAKAKPAPQPVTPDGGGSAAGLASPIFNGKDLTGWKGLTNLWSVKDGMIVGSTTPDGIKFNTCLFSEREYGDFELKCKVKLVGAANPNAGIQVRSKVIDAAQFAVAGPQADLGGGYWGSLYGEKSGGMMQAANAAAVNVKPADFNEVLVRCVGKRVTIVLNGGTTVDREFATLPDRGIVGFQLHSGNGLEVTVKDIEFKELPAEAAAETGFVSIFNGTDLTGWRETGTAGGYSVKDGELTVRAPKSDGPREHGWLMTEKAYSDFRLEFEYAMEAGTDTGIGFRCDPAVEPQAEVTFADMTDPEIAKVVGNNPTLRTGGLAQCVSDAAAPVRRLGEWNQVSIELLDRALTVTVNGTVTTRTTLDQHAAKVNRPGLTRAAGPIGIQKRWGVSRFRSVRVKELTPPPADGFVSIFNGTDLTGWVAESNDTAKWKVENGAIAVTVTEASGVESWLLSEKSYKDFVAKFEFKAEGGTTNSGFGFRCVPNERPVLDGSGVPTPSPSHLQIALCGAPKDGNQLWATGALLVSWTPQRSFIEKADSFGKQKPDGEWNEMEVESRGQSLKVRLNGNLIYDSKLENHAKRPGVYPGLKRAEGRIGFKRGGGAAGFRNVRVKELPTAAAAAEVGFTSLFNGKDLAGWVNQGRARVVGDAIEIVPGGRLGPANNPKTTGDYGPDFQLKCEFWLPLEANKQGQQRANSGIYLLDRYEIQILDSKGKGIPPQFACGALYGDLAPSSEAALPPEQWQTLDITFRAPLPTRKGELTVVLNGVTVIDRGTVEKTSGGAVDARLVPRGPIALQDHGSPVRFRNLRVKELTAAAAAPANDFVPLLNGKDLKGWTTAGPPAWEWKAGRVVGSPAANAGAGAGVLMTEAEYDDFELELQYKHAAGIGSGLFLRADPAAPVAGGQHLEVQIIDDAFPQWAQLPPIQKTGSAYNVFERKVDPPVKKDDWNAMRVRLVRRQLQVWVNDVQTIDADLDSAAAIAKYDQNPGLKRSTGRIGLQQNQRVPVEFRNVRVKRVTP